MRRAMFGAGTELSSFSQADHRATWVL